MTNDTASLAPLTPEELAEKGGMIVTTCPQTPTVSVLRIPGPTWRWVARISGRHPRYRYEREFLEKLDGDYVLDGGIYEACAPDGVGRQYVMHCGAGRTTDDRSRGCRCDSSRSIGKALALLLHHRSHNMGSVAVS